MIRHLPELFPDEDALRHRAERVAARTHELGTFLVHVLGRTELGARFQGRVTWHDACHGLRELGIHDEPRALIRGVEGAKLVEVEGADACCGFGGKFSVQHPELSGAIADRKLEGVLASGVDAVVSGDVGCLMQLGGRLARVGSPIRALHLAELLAAR
jgi:L-lactate dehydrogenase complex protein LldE